MTTDLEELKRLCEAATPGPWIAGSEQHDEWEQPFVTIGPFEPHPASGGDHYEDALARTDGANFDAVANAAFIAAARTAVPDLISRLEASESALAAEREKVGRLTEAASAALRQWEMYAATEEIRDLASEKSAEGDLLRFVRSAIKEATDG